jgi:hypothetical protein
MLGGMLRPPAASAAINPRTTWLPAGTLVAHGPINDLAQQVLWTTIMRVDDKLASARDKYYLWHSTHDVPILRLYTAPAITGPYTERPQCVLPAAPAGWKASHFQAPDIAWDPIGRRFIASPHSSEAAGAPRAMQNSFLMVSGDGENWSYLPGAAQPFVPIGAQTEFDGYALDYGRFLRDYDGSLKRRNGKYVWYYRGTKRTSVADPRSPTGRSTRETFQLGAATSPDLVTWTKVPGPIGDPGASQLFGLGSALDVAGVTNLMWTIAVAGFAGPQMYLKPGASPDPAQFDPGPGIRVFEDASIFYDGPSYVLDGDTHYMTYGAQNTVDDQWEVRLIRSPVPTDPFSVS